jgi:predicted RND superfamily exporter protein
MLGRCVAVESRALLVLAAVMTVGLSIVASMGLAQIFGQFYGPVHSVLPFLLLGLGIDDAFVIANEFALQCGEQHPVGSPQRMALSARPLKDQLAAAMRHAGVSVTVTSMTDLVAFAIGTTTRLPALSSFCAYAALGILTLYLMMSTFFAAAVAVDAKRQRANRRECCCCCKAAEPGAAHVAEAQAAAIAKGAELRPRDLELAGATPPGDLPPPPGSRMRRYFQDVHAPLLLRTPVKIAVVVVFAALFGVGIYGATQLEMDFHYEWFFPDDCPRPPGAAGRPWRSP